MRVIISGDQNLGRPNYDAMGRDAKGEFKRASRERTLLNEALSTLHRENRITHLIAADDNLGRIGVDWAKARGIPATTYICRRNGFSKESPVQRDLRMMTLANPDVLVEIGNAGLNDKAVHYAERAGLRLCKISILSRPKGALRASRPGDNAK